MKKIFIVFGCLVVFAPKAHADFFGGDLAPLTEIALNTLNTFQQLKTQSEYWGEEMDGVQDKIQRLQTIANLVQPASWKEWSDPQEALRRLKLIYDTMPVCSRQFNGNLLAHLWQP